MENIENWKPAKKIIRKSRFTLDKSNYLEKEIVDNINDSLLSESEISFRSFSEKNNNNFDLKDYIEDIFNSEISS